MISNLLQDIRFGIRVLGKSPGVTLLAVFALALGIGANSAIFSIVSGILLRPLPVEDPSRLVVLFESNQQAGVTRGLVSHDNFRDLREQAASFEGAAAFSARSFNLRSASEPERASGARVTADFFRLLGAHPALGRSFSEDEDRPGGGHVVVLSHGLWQRRFGSASAAVGQTLALDGETYTVVGVMPADFQFPDKETELWTPLAYDSAKDSADAHNLNVVARLRPGVSEAQARAEVSALGARLQAKNNAGRPGWGFSLITLSEFVVGNIRPAFLILFGAVAFVLLIACANVVNLLLARASARQQEIAIRSAVGATPFRIIRQLFTESVLLALAGGALGLGLAHFGIKLLLASLPGSLSVPRADEIGLDAWVLLFTLAVSLLTGLLCGLAPALRLAKPDLTTTLKDVAKGAAVGRRRARGLLVASEVALALVLLVGAGLMVKSFILLQGVELGFKPEGVLTLEVSLPETKYADERQAAVFHRQVLERLAALPGVNAAGAVNRLPLSGLNTNTFVTIEGSQTAEAPLAGYRSVSPGYFTSLGIPLRKGRAFDERDAEGAQGVVIVNETMARRFWPNSDPLGQRLKRGDASSTRPWLTVVGVIGDVRHSAVNQDPKPEMFLPYAQSPERDMSFTLRTASDPKSFAASARAAVLAVDADQPVANVRSMEEVVSEAGFGRRATTVLLLVFGVVALVLAAVGIYGVISYSVAQRRREIGIRMALGAQKGDVLRLILRQGMTLVLAGVAVGLVLAVASASFMSSLLYGVTGTDPVTLAGVTALLSAVALVACLVPALRATKLDPMIALRHD